MATDPMSISSGDAMLIERLTVDKQLLTKLLVERNISNVIKEASFEISDPGLMRLEAAIKKIRTYTTDQLHVLSLKASTPQRPFESGNGAVDW